MTPLAIFGDLTIERCSFGSKTKKADGFGRLLLKHQEQINKNMLLWPFFCAAFLLSLERICYWWIWKNPEKFQNFCAHPAVAIFGEPIAVLEKLFYIFKLIQAIVFIGWCMLYGETLLPQPTAGFWPLSIGLVLIIAGQILNFGVFFRLGRPGVFYGNKLGYDIPWCDAFPFSVLNHPQYVGALLSVWGFFLIMRFPNSDWIVLPLLETVYYTAGRIMSGRESDACVGCALRTICGG